VIPAAAFLDGEDGCATPTIWISVRIGPVGRDIAAVAGMTPFLRGFLRVVLYLIAFAALPLGVGVATLYLPLVPGLLALVLVFVVEGLIVRRRAVLRSQAASLSASYQG